MDTPTAEDTAREERANRLYWESESSVNDIAESMDISKGALYGMVRPLSAGIACPECGDEMEYPNRTARDKGFVHCPTCGLEEDEEVVVEAGDGERTMSVTADDEAARQRLIWGGALLGAAAGLLLLRWARR